MTGAAPYRYRGREISPADVGFLRRLIAERPQASRYALSLAVCEAWDWKQANGHPRDMVCRGLLAALARAGAIELPPARRAAKPRAQTRPRPEPVVPDNRPVGGPLAALGEVAIEPVRRTPREALFDSLVEQYHYLKYAPPVGEHVKYLVTARGQAIACLAWSSAPRHLGPRDRWIGWSAEARRRNLQFIAYNTRFLILPWARVPHLASHLLGRMAARISRDWERLYAHPLYLLETFVDPARFAATCYRAANWVAVGRTTGRGQNDLTHRPNRPVKEVLVYPLHRRFRETLSR
jgi:hypothetical protein